ncbi:DNA polymerase III, polC-type [Mycoplasma haemocanis str. Illinois]|uniref:DNA polymerase III, polC-type n=1 Tax=Mycoplasma haemocanis (strain Illinois) TaxID=1111676 RepID=H6N5N8_MYCHN|nr:DNA polymerase III subunit alpha [Mycoplasma haemocanis]AEW44998.1 DNA polymerase III, polC-type [Mycoplasma haemocanis str. Illinois]
MKSTFIVSPDYRKRKRYNVYCVLDIETTGFNHKIEEITEISIHRCCNEKRVDKYHKNFVADLDDRFQALNEAAFNMFKKPDSHK